MEEALRARFLALPALSGAKVSWFERPRRAAMPHVLLTAISPGEDWEHDGPDELTQPRTQIDIWAAENAPVMTIARALLAELRRTTNLTVSGIRFEPPAIVYSDRKSMDPLDGGDDLFRRTIDFAQWVRPA